jgi:ABC-2 type transport system permease protein
MQALLALTVANIKSYLRDRAALFWTLAFPLIFIFMFGFIFQEGGQSRLTLGWVDEDQSPAVTQLREAFAAQAGTEIVEASQDDALARMRQGEVDAVIVVPADPPRSSCIRTHRVPTWSPLSTSRCRPCSASSTSVVARHS